MRCFIQEKLLLPSSSSSSSCLGCRCAKSAPGSLGTINASLYFLHQLLQLTDWWGMLGISGFCNIEFWGLKFKKQLFLQRTEHYPVSTCQSWARSRAALAFFPRDCEDMIRVGELMRF